MLPLRMLCDLKFILIFNNEISLRPDILIYQHIFLMIRTIVYNYLIFVSYKQVYHIRTLDFGALCTGIVVVENKIKIQREYTVQHTSYIYIYIVTNTLRLYIRIGAQFMQGLIDAFPNHSLAAASNDLHCSVADHSAPQNL